MHSVILLVLNTPGQQCGRRPVAGAAEVRRACPLAAPVADLARPLATQVAMWVALRVAWTKDKVLLELCDRRGLSRERKPHGAAIALAKHHFCETDGAFVRLLHNWRARCHDARSGRRYASLAHVLRLFHLGKLRGHGKLCVGS